MKIKMNKIFKNKIIVISILLLSLLLVNVHFTKTNFQRPLINKEFPLTINNNWVGTDVKASEITYTMLDEDELLLRDYSNKKTGQVINLAIVMTTKRDHIHDPKLCYTGQGIQISSEKIVKLQPEYPIKYVYGLKQKQPYDIYYWYTDLNNTFTSRVAFMKRITLAKFLDKPMSGFALVVVITPKNNNKNIESFIKEINNRLIEMK